MRASPAALTLAAFSFALPRSAAERATEGAAAEGGACRCAQGCREGSPRPKSLKDLFEAAGTDKAWKHGYHRYYERELAPYRDLDGLRLLEIGIGGGGSMRAWAEYFTAPGSLQGMDARMDPEEARLEVCRHIGAPLCGLVKVHAMDQANETALRGLVSAEPRCWDIVIDDGSHVPAHQVITFRHLFPAVCAGGLYVVEDIETSYQEEGDISGYPLRGGIGARLPQYSAVEKFKELADVASRGHFYSPGFTALGREVDEHVVRVSFGDGILFIEKRPNEDDWNRFYPPPEHRWWQIPAFARMVERYEARREVERPLEAAREAELAARPAA